MDMSVWVNELLEREEILEHIKQKILKQQQYQPCITFSREPGSGGRPIAEIVAKRLNYKLYDKELVQQIAKGMNKPSKLLSKVDEKERSAVMDIVQNIFNPDYIPDESYVRILCEAVLKISRTGRAVIVGRGANFIVPAAYGLHVQIVAPYKVRVARAVRHEKIDYQKARDIVSTIGEERRGFVRQYFGKDTHSPRYYDLTINTTFYSLEQAAEIVMSAYTAKFPNGEIPSVIQ